MTAEVKAMKGAPLRDLSDQIRQKKQAQAVVLGSVDDGRAYLVVNLDRSLVERGIDAVPVAREAGKMIGGGGGGRPNDRRGRRQGPRRARRGVRELRGAS